jgi:hypothetical protein
MLPTMVTAMRSWTARLRIGPHSLPLVGTEAEREGAAADDYPPLRRAAERGVGLVEFALADVHLLRLAEGFRFLLAHFVCSRK